MSEYVIMPYDDYKGVCDTIRAASGKTDLIKSGDMSGEITELIDNPKLSFKLCTLPSTSGLEVYNFISGNGKFIFLCNNCAIYSDDGINWSKSTLPSGVWYPCAYGNGTFVALDRTQGSAKVIYSKNGINWYTCTLPISFTTSQQFCNIAYGNGRFVAFYSYSNDAIYSDDGINWSICNDATGYTNWIECAYGNGRFVAYTEGATCTYSTDGVTWNSYAADEIDYVIYKNGLFLSDTSYSYDGINWELCTLPDNYRLETSYITYGNNKFIYFDGYTKKIKYSDNGIVWKSCALPSGCLKYNDIEHINGKFIAPCRTVSYDSGNNKCAYSYDGINWELCTLPGYTTSDTIVANCDGKCVIFTKNDNSYNAFYCDLNVGIK